MGVLYIYRQILSILLTYFRKVFKRCRDELPIELLANPLSRQGYILVKVNTLNNVFRYFNFDC
jgi:hypothetical protein